MKSFLSNRLFRFLLGIGISFSIVEWINPAKAQDTSSFPTYSVTFCNAFIQTLQNQTDQIPKYSQQISDCNDTFKAYQSWASNEMSKQSQCEFDAQLHNQSGADCLRNITPVVYDRTQVNR